jgi:hypothetical protein
MVATQIFQHPRTSTAERLGAQAQGRHYSTFSFYTPQELRAAIATFLARLPGPEVSWVDEHLLVIVGRSRHNQVESDGPASLANQAIKDHAPQISAGRASEAPNRCPGGRAQITPLCAQSIAGDDLRQSAQNWAALCADARKLKLLSVTGFPVSLRPRLAEFEAVDARRPNGPTADGQSRGPRAAGAARRENAWLPRPPAA